jgi:nanoRNase/pAp phosphatase (c-di-AMP/oligoRNAs hydrolase)
MQKIQEVIKKGQNFLVMGHRNVDGDAYGSSMALYFYLQGLGKTVEVVNSLSIIRFTRKLSERISMRFSCAIAENSLL